MSILNIVKKMFAPPRDEYDEYGNLIRKRKSIEEQLLEKHEEREYRKRVRARLEYLQRKHDNELKPFHLKKPKGKYKYYYR